MSFFIIFY